MADEGMTIALAFHTDDPMFVRGVEIGRLWEQLKSGDEIVQEIHADNAEMAIRLAEATHREFTATEEINGWIEVTYFAANTPTVSERGEADDA